MSTHHTQGSMSTLGTALPGLVLTPWEERNLDGMSLAEWEAMDGPRLSRCLQGIWTLPIVASVVHRLTGIDWQDITCVREPDQGPGRVNFRDEVSCRWHFIQVTWTMDSQGTLTGTMLRMPGSFRVLLDNLTAELRGRDDSMP